MADFIDRHIGGRLRRRRRLVDLTQAELGQRVGLSFQQIQKYECGTQRLSVSTLCRIAWVLGVEPAYFLTDLPKPVEVVDAGENPAPLRRVRYGKA
jgi:transcriptional regulator with XRE-family HTH domain